MQESLGSDPTCNRHEGEVVLIGIQDARQYASTDPTQTVRSTNAPNTIGSVHFALTLLRIRLTTDGPYWVGPFPVQFN
jgi:hypothetical protein